MIIVITRILFWNIAATLTIPKTLTELTTLTFGSECYNIRVECYNIRIRILFSQSDLVTKNT